MPGEAARSRSGPNAPGAFPEMTRRWTDLLDELRRADLLVGAPPEGPHPSGIGTDSRTIGAGQLYVAVRGSQADGHRFVPDAVRRGAAVVVVEQAEQAGVPEIVVRDGRRAALVLGSAWYGHPGRRLTLIGVTGTNGKTTTTADPPPARPRSRFRKHRHARAFDGRGERCPRPPERSPRRPDRPQATLCRDARPRVHRITMEALLPQPGPGPAGRAHLRPACSPT
jgi:hypothetical protein